MVTDVSKEVSNVKYSMSIDLEPSATKMKTFFETSESTYLKTQRRIPEKWNPLLHGCKNRKTCKNTVITVKTERFQNDEACIVNTLLLRQRPSDVFIY